MHTPQKLIHGLAVTFALIAGFGIAEHRAPTEGPVLASAHAFVTASPITEVATAVLAPAPKPLSAVESALEDVASAVHPLSRPNALATAFHSYYAYQAAHPEALHNPYLYFVDYGLPSTTPRGYLFDMVAHRVVEGPFTVAHGRGSSVDRQGVPTHFSNATGSAATSLGLYVTQALYNFHGHAWGGAYSSTGLRLLGVSRGFNDNAFARGVVAHGAPYVTDHGSGRSEGCPAMSPERAARLLPKIAQGGAVFLFAPDQSWLSSDPWVTSESAS